MGYEKRKRAADAPAHLDAKQSTQQRGSKMVWVDGYLSDTDRDWLETNADQRMDVITELLIECAGMHGISCKPDNKSGKWLACLFWGADPSEPPTHCLTHRAATPITALYVLGYKHMVKFERAWQNSASPDASKWD